ncbi:DUF397 domain-containing protein [Nonomuraea sp. NPDC050394]|uniref:DUF397 domain-containing protein n=1 Tax=Nonomuraea sp. NPDC050394 TaxID=3364363 RepID=UPI003791297F
MLTPDWGKSPHSESGGCVEVRLAGGVVELRDSKDRGGPVLRFTEREWTAFELGAKDGEFALP